MNWCHNSCWFCIPQTPAVIPGSVSQMLNLLTVHQISFDLVGGKNAFLTYCNLCWGNATIRTDASDFFNAITQ